MSDLPMRRPRFLPDRLGDRLDRALEQQEAAALVRQRGEALDIERAVHLTEYGMVGIATISMREAALIRAVPHAEARLRAAADAGTGVILGRIFEAGL